jgi:hypothetical protein
MAIGMYAAQLWMVRLTTPWYLPIITTVGAVLCLAALWQQRSVWRVLALIVVVLLAGAEWTFLLAFRLPAYSGPAIVGQPFPSFATAKADGTPFTHDDLKGEQNTVLVFFRGRW